MTVDGTPQAGNIVSFELERAPIELFRLGPRGALAMFEVAAAGLVVAAVLWGRHLPLALAMTLFGLVIVLASWLHARPPKEVPSIMLKLGVDGLLLGDEWVSWAVFERCEVVDDQISIFRRSKETMTTEVLSVVETTAPGTSQSIRLVSVADFIDDEHKRYLARPVVPALPAELKDEHAGLQEDYRGSNRALLVRVATHPGAEIEDRKVAVRALASDPNARAQIEAELDHTLDDEVALTLRMALYHPKDPS